MTGAYFPGKHGRSYMSGGHYDYAFTRIEMLAEEMFYDAKYDPERFNPPADICKFMLEFSEQLKKIALMAHDLEWFMSGDIDEEYLRKSIKKYQENK